MEMLVNTHVALKTVKGKTNQLFTLQSQVNVDSLLFYSVALLILCPGLPEINPELKNQSVAYNSSLHLICFLSAFPTLTVHWTKDGVNLGNNNTYAIRQARLKHSGQYTCSAKNSGGSKNSTFWIEVAGGTVLICI